MRRTLGSFLFLLAAGLAAAGETGLTADEKGTVVTLGNLKSRAPEAWTEEPVANQMRLKQFRLPAQGKDKDPAEIAIFFFGAGGGGSAKDNIKRWQSQFTPPAGKQADDLGKVDVLKIGDVKATYLDIEGTYNNRMPGAKNPVAKEDQRMLGVVLETKGDNYFIRLLGPKETVSHFKKGFDEWLKAFK